MLQPLRRRTWAPRGRPPVQYAWDRRDRLSAIGALTLAPWALRIGLYFQLLEHNVKADDVVRFLKQLHRQLRRPLIVVWDRWQVHRSAARALRDCPWVEFEWLPAYAPELDPVEAVWNHTKYSDLANFIPDDVDHLRYRIKRSINHQRYDSYLKYSYFRYAALA
jgi:putative transposase